MKFSRVYAIAAVAVFVFAAAGIAFYASGDQIAPETGTSYDRDLLAGATYTYSPTYNVTSGLTMTLSGTASAWLNKSGTSPNFTISGTAPTNFSGDSATYDLLITVNTTHPNQTATQSIHFTVYKVLTVGTTTSDIIFEGDSVSITSTTNMSSGVVFSSSDLPAGLTCSNDGTISGTVTRTYSGSSDYETITSHVRGTHSASNQVKEYTITFTMYKSLVLSVDTEGYAVKGTSLSTVFEDADSGSFDNVSSNLSSGMSYSATVKVGSGSAVNATGASNAQSGIYVDASTGAILGTPSASGDYTIVITGMHSASGQPSVSKTVTLHVVDPMGFTSAPSGEIFGVEA